MAPHTGQHITRHENLRQTRDYRTKTKHFEHQRDLIAKERDAILPTLGSVMVVVVMMTGVVVMVLS
jgi:hypothetical protein